MGSRTLIEWTDASWNPVRGCSRVSKGCENCYAERIAVRFSGRGQPYEGLVHSTGAWNGRVVLVHDALAHPLRWTRPRKIFVNSMSDLFHPAVADDWLDRIFAVMSLAPGHTFQVLTKHPRRMLQYLQQVDREAWAHHAAVILHATAGGRSADAIARANARALKSQPLANVWVGVSVEDQDALDERVPILARVPAVCRFVSCEPLLAPLDFTPPHWRGTEHHRNEWLDALDWLIAGGESGPSARPMHVEWVRSLRDACASRSGRGRAPLPFFFKQWGNWLHCSQRPTLNQGDEVYRWKNDATDFSVRLPKKQAGRVLDGRTWTDFPRLAAAA